MSFNAEPLDGELCIAFVMLRESSKTLIEDHISQYELSAGPGEKVVIGTKLPSDWWAFQHDIPYPAPLSHTVSWSRK